MRKTKFYFLLLIVFITSCKKESSEYGQIVNMGGLGMSQYYSGVNKVSTNGSFLFQSNVTNNDSIVNNVAELNGFFNKEGGGIEPGGPIYINNIQILPDSSGEYANTPGTVPIDFYGMNLTFILSPPNDSNNVVSGTLYSPARIHITNVLPRAALNIRKNSSILITWNKDPNNQKGVVLSIGGQYSNFGNSILVPDNGSYILPWSFFSKFPPNTQTTLWAERGDFIILKSGQNKYRVGGWSATAIWDVEIKP